MPAFGSGLSLQLGASRRRSDLSGLASLSLCVSLFVSGFARIEAHDEGLTPSPNVTAGLMGD